MNISLREYLLDNSIPEPNSGCRLWVGRTNHKGYGEVNYGGRRWIASRLSYYEAFGAIPDDKPCVCHKCDTPACIEPDHLFAGTHQDNTDDQIRKDRLPRGEDCAFATLTNAQVVAIKSDPRVMLVIANEYAVSTSLIEHIKAGRRWGSVPGQIVKINRMRESRNQGQNHPLTMFTDEDIRAIRRDGRANHAIAAERGVGRRCIDRIKTGERWGHLR